MNDNAFIVCDGLVKIYKIANLEVVALQGLDLVVNRGELLGIVGASGSGKTTLMNILGGLDRPSAGRVRVEGNDLLKMSEMALNRYRRTKVGFVWQQGARNLIPYLSALENVRLPLTLAGQAGKKARKRAEALLDSVGLSERRHHRLVEMSGGEQQRVAIAVALANSPTLLLADEPTGEVDTITAAGIFNLLQELNRQYGLTTLVVSHDQAIARYMDRVVAIRDGKTSSETVRQTVVPGTPAASVPSTTAVHAEGEHHTDVIFEEVILLDSAGRLQVPRDLLERYDFKGRALVEPVDGGILVKPAQVLDNGQASTVPDQDHPTTEGRGIKSLLNRLRREKPERREP